jgi:hypothetical protein
MPLEVVISATAETNPTTPVIPARIPAGQAELNIESSFQEIARQLPPLKT